MISQRYDQTAVSVIIPVKDDWSRLGLCLDTLLTQDFAGSTEIIVVDDHSSEPCPKHLTSDPRVSVVTGSGCGSYAARNRGIDHANHDILAFTDADCLPSPQWLRAGVYSLSQTGQVPCIVAGRIVMFPVEGTKITAAGAYDLVYGIRQQAFVKRGFAATANLFTTRFTIEHCGPFDPSVESGGDKEWCLRARSHGAIIRYADNAVVRHPTRNSVAAIEAKIVRITRGRLQRISRENGRIRKTLQLLLPPPQPLLFMVGSHQFGLGTRVAVFLMGFRLWWARIRAVLKSRPFGKGALT